MSEPHKHVADQTSDILALSWCKCGAETRGRGWREPKTWRGKQLRMQWRNA